MYVYEHFDLLYDLLGTCISTLWPARYVYEHSERHGYPGEWIGITFSITTFWNGILAILAGQIAIIHKYSLWKCVPFVYNLSIYDIK